jgi:hypothetical protein
MAPGLGLYLDEVFFEGYNAKQENELKFISKQDEKKAKKEKKGGTETEGEGEERVCNKFDYFIFYVFLQVCHCYSLPRYLSFANSSILQHDNLPIVFR